VFIRFVKKLANPWTTENDLLEEFRLFRQVYAALTDGEKVVVHFMDGEVGFNFFGTYAKFLGKERNKLRLMATYHQPGSYLQKVFPKKNKAGELDAVLTVGRSQFPFFDFMPESKIIFVPHGVDTDFFQPGKFQEHGDKLFCLTVGQWLRDFDALEEVIRIAPPKMIFRIVAIKENLKRFQGLQNVELYSGINDEELRRLYQGSHIGLLPLRDSTANNSLLEMMASGLPVIVTRVGSIEDYTTDDSCLLISENNPENILDHIQSLSLSRDKRKKLGQAARKKVIEFSWSRIAEQMADVYGMRKSSCKKS